MFKLRNYLIILAILLSIYLYAALTGWKFFGSNSEKWSPKQEKGHHK
ncbi:MAG: hypothetical protein NVV82_04725 [Sporocytophaga sp.]|nr:hypothetical protein [Sporocytophaga sp.]